MPDHPSAHTRSAAEATEKLVSRLSGDPDMAELVALFVEEMPQRVATVLGCLEAGELSEMKRAAHQLKRACGGYGFPEVGAAAGALEKLLSQGAAGGVVGDLESIRRSVDGLVEMCRRVSV